jgi:hypothetical protein
MNKNWHGIITIEEIKLVSKENEVIWEKRNLKNMIHTTGEEFFLGVLFNGVSIPEKYFFGLDNRSSLTAAQTMGSLIAEPAINGYSRQQVTSTTFVMTEVGGITVARSPILIFSATGGSWGPVQNLFLTDEGDATGYLISSVALTDSVTVTSGQSIYVRMGISLRDCPP